MSHVIVPNQSAPTVSDGFFGIWKLTRALLAAGWKYKASGDATAAGTKDTTGSFINEKWGIGGGVNLTSTVQSATGSVVFTAATDGTVTLTFTGTAFTALSVGRMLTVSGAVNAVNNGTFRITTFTSGTSIKIFNSTATTETTSVTWAEKQGGSNGTISTAGTGAATVGRAIFAVSSGTPFVVPTTAPMSRGSVGDRLTIANGAIGANNGHFVITRVITSTSVEIENSAATSSGETNNGSLHWTQVSPTAQTEPNGITGTNGTGPWICLQGPSIMKIPIGTNVTTGTFLRGEKVTQTTSGATGTIIGVLTDASGGLGYLVVEPRLNGTGGGPRGWTSAGTDTVSAVAAPVGSGATVTSTAGPPVEYVREMVWWKSTQAAAHCWYQCVDQAGESASRFSVLATAGGVTNAIAPGGPAATFPTPGSFVVWGTANSGAVGTGASNLYNNNYTANYGFVHAIAATCIENSTEGADGSFILMHGSPVTSPGTYIGAMLQRCDNSEDGDVDPYVIHPGTAAANYNSSRTTADTTATTADWFRADTYFAVGSYTPIRGWRRRGFATGDAFQTFQGAVTASLNTTSVALQNVASPCRIANSFQTNFIREPLWVVSAQLGQKMRKGSLRWMFVTEGGVTNQTYATAAWIQAGTGSAPLVVGPWDGQTVATNA